MANLPGGKIIYTEVYSLVREEGNFPVDAIIDYKSLGPKKWAIINIPAFTTSNRVNIPVFQFESQQLLSSFDIIKGEILTVAQNFFNGEGLLAPSFILKSTTESQTNPNPTPQQVNEQTQNESDKSNEQQTITNLTQTDDKVVSNNTPTDLKPQGSDKLAIILNKKGSEIKKFIIPIVVSLATQIGIKNIGTLKAKIPDTCLTKPELDKIVNTRNQIVNKLNDAVKVIDIFSKVLAGVSIITGVTLALIRTLSTARTAISVATKAIPTIPVPGSVVTGLDDLKNAQDIAITRLTKISGVTAAASLSLIVINSILLKIIGMLNSIDSYLKQCAPDASLIPLSDTLLDLITVNNDIKQNETQQTYNGFILEIVEEPYSSTVNRRKVVAKNSQGIILLSTPLTFSTDTQTLINEIKLIIDSSNLKAY
jgi:hypothetical protein